MFYIIGHEWQQMSCGLKHRLTNGEHGSDGEPSVKLNVFLRILLRLPQYTRTNLLFVSLFNCPAVAYRVLLHNEAKVAVAAMQHILGQLFVVILTPTSNRPD